MCKHMPLSAFEAPIELKSGESFSDDASDVVTKALSELSATVEERFKEIEAKSGERLDKIETRLNRPGIIGRAVETKEDAGAVEKKAFESWARKGIERVDPIEVKALSVAVNANGGYLVPPSWQSEIVRNLVLFSPIRSVARVMATNSSKITIPKRTGITNATWIGETAARSESDLTFGQQNISIHELATYVDVSRQLLEDNAYNLEQELAFAIAQDFGEKEGVAFVNGLGDAFNQPVGFMTNTSVPVVNAAGAHIASDDLIALYHALPNAYAANAVWLMNRTTIGKIRAFKSTTGEYLWAPGTGENGLVPGNAGTLLGRPVIEVKDMPDDAPSTISVAFADMGRAYRIFDRVQVEVQRDPFSIATTGQIRFNAWRRVGGDVVLPEAARFLKTTA